MKRYIVFSLLICVMFMSAIACVSASENISDYALKESIEGQNIAVDENNIEVSVPQEDILSIGEESFSQLSLKISNANSNSTLNLDKDYKCTSNSEKDVEISKPLTINGNGHVVDGNGFMRIVRVTSSDVTLTNITFKNFNYVGSGGAIYWDGSDGVLTNCKFINCTTGESLYGSGGAIYWEAPNGFLSNCEFNDCSLRVGGSVAYANGGAVYWRGTNGVLTDCKFTNCRCVAEAVSSSNDINAEAKGGAICWDGSYGKVIGCEFFQCYAPSTITTPPFNPRAYTSQGAAINWDGKYGLIDSCIFRGIPESEHNVVYITGANVEIISSIFIDNPTRNIWWDAENGKISNCVLISCSQRYLISSYDYDLDANYNWWGNTIDNISPSNDYFNKRVDASKWLYLDASYEEISEGGNSARIKINLNNLVENNKASEYSNSKLPDLTFTVKAGDETFGADVKKGYGIMDYDFKTNPSSINVQLSNVNLDVALKSVKTTNINANDVNTVYNSGKKLIVTLKDIDGNALAGKMVKVNVGSISKTLKTNANGQVSLDVSTLVPKSYTAKFSFAGDDGYTSSSNSAKVVVKQASVKFTAKAATFKVKVKSKQYTITLKNNKGKAMNKAKVTLKVKGKTYKATTNAKGKATFKITNLSKKNNYSATVTFTGDKYFKASNKKVKITVK